MTVSSIPDEKSLATGWFLQGQVPPDGHPLRMTIAGNRFIVGRRLDSSLCLSDPSISKLHAEFFTTGESLYARDLGSTNGTYVNGIRIEGAVRVDECDIVQFANFEFIIGRISPDDGTRTQVSTVTEWMQTLTQFHRLLTEKALVPHFQPIVKLCDRQTIGYEVLARSILPGMVSPREMFEAAERANMAPALSVLCRQTGLEVAERLAPNVTIFVNTHPSERNDAGLLDSLYDMRRNCPHQPIVLELHEAALTAPADLVGFRRELQHLQIGLAYDDFGAGLSRLQELATVAPDYLKFDIGLIRQIHLSPQRQQIVAGLVRLALDLGIQPLAEGIECQQEADVCTQIGFTHAQGYFYGRPAPELSLVPPTEDWDMRI